MSSLSAVTASPEVQDLHVKLSTSPHVEHRIVSIVLKALAHLEDTFKGEAEFDAQSVLEECESLTAQQQILALNIIHVGLKKYELLGVLNQPLGWTTACNEAIAERIQTLQHGEPGSALKSLVSMGRFVESVLVKLENLNLQPEHEEYVEKTNECVKILSRIYEEWGGLHITSEEVVNCHIGTSEDKMTHLKGVVKCLTELRNLVKSTVRMHLFYYKGDEVRQNYIQCLHALNRYLATQLKDITVDEILALEPEIPEMLEILWAATSQREENKRNGSENLFKRDLGIIRSIPSVDTAPLLELKQRVLKLGPFPEHCSFEALRKFNSLVKDRIQGLRDWHESSEYQTTEERQNEVLESQGYYEHCLRKFDLKRVTNYGFPIRDF